MASPLPATPKLIPLFSVSLPLSSSPQPLFTDGSQNSSSTMAIVSGGNITTIKNDLGLEFDVAEVSGYDNITVYTEKGTNELDASLHGKICTGEDVQIKSFGIIQRSSEVEAVLGGAAISHSFENSYLSMSPRVTFSGATPEKYSWIEKENLIGKSRFVVEHGIAYVQYFIYLLR